MNNEDAVSIRDKIKIFVSISDTAERFGISRPTLYMYMDSYDDGDSLEIPANLKGFFDLVSTDPDPDQVRLYLMSNGSPKDVSDIKPVKMKSRAVLAKDEYDRLVLDKERLTSYFNQMQSRLKDYEKRIEKIDEEKKMLLKLVSMNPDSNPMYKDRLEELDRIGDEYHVKCELTYKQGQTMHVELIRLNERIEALKQSALESVVGKGGIWNDDDGLLTKCIISNGKVMILFTLVNSEDSSVKPQETKVTVLSEAKGHPFVVGTYRPEEGKSFVLIDDLIPGLDMTYEVEMKYDDHYIVSDSYEMRLR